MKAIAHRHGVSATLLKIWLEKYQRGDYDEDVLISVKARKYEARLRALEQRTGELERMLGRSGTRVVRREPERQ